MIIALLNVIYLHRYRQEMSLLRKQFCKESKTCGKREQVEEDHNLCLLQLYKWRI